MNLRGTLYLTVFAAFLITATAASPASLDVFPDESSTKVGKYTSFELTVENTGPVDDVYRISSSRPSETTIAPKKVPEQGTLSPGESRTVQVWYNPDVSREAGTYSLKLTAESEATGERYSTEASVEVIRTHNVELEVQNPGTVCEGQEAVYILNIENTGTQAETFRINPEAGSLSQKEIEVDSGAKEQVTLTRKSSIAVEDRAFNIGVNSVSSYAEDTASTSFRVENCYETETGIEPSQKSVAALTQSEYTVTVENTGTRSDSLNLSTNYGTLEDSSLTIASGDSRQTVLTVEPQEVQDRTVRVTAEGESRSSATARMNVYNGQNMTARFEETGNVCENQRFEREVTVVNNGAAEETYTVSSNIGNLSASNFTLETGEERRIEVELDSSNYREGASKKLNLNVRAETFGSPRKTFTNNFKVENCHDLKMSVVPSVRSAGENRSVLYEVALENTGTRANTYTVMVEGPDWVSVRPEQVTVEPGQTGKSYIYAGIPYNRSDGNIEITAIAEGEQVRKKKSVDLILGEKVRDSIRSDEGGLLTSNFLAPFRQGIETIQVSMAGKILASILLGLLLTAGILAREW